MKFDIDNDTKQKLLSLIDSSFSEINKDQPIKIESLQCSQRPGLGADISLDMYRYVRVYALRNILGSRFSAKILYQSGRQLASQFSITNISDVIELFAKLKIGFVYLVESSDKHWVFEEEECATCYGLPIINEAMCQFEAGIICGLLEKLVNHSIIVTETKCWGLGDQVCRFEAELAMVELEEELENYFDEATLVSVIAGKAVGAIDFANQLTKHNKKLEEERQLAAEVIQAFLPEEKSIGNLDFAFLYRPSSEIGGDFVDIIELDADKTLIFLSDVSGHGIRAALFTASIKISLDRMAGNNTNPADILQQLNQEIESMVERTGFYFFVACFIGIYDNKAGEFYYATAGFPAPLKINRTNARVEKLPGKAPALGLVKGRQFSEHKITFNSEDKFVFFTDGLIELGGKNKLLTIDDLVFLLEENKEKDKGELLKIVEERLATLLRNNKAQDDITLLVVDIK